jgi:hypothetical protein
MGNPSGSQYPLRLCRALELLSETGVGGRSSLPSGEGPPQGHENALVDLAVLEAAERGVVGGGGTKPGTLS